MSESTSSPMEPERPRSRGFKRWIFLSLVLLGAATIGHIWYWGGRIDARVYQAADLEAGPVTQIVAWDHGRTAVQVSRLTKLQQPDHAWQVVTDQGNFDKFMPFVRSTTVEPGQDGKLLEKQILDLSHGSYNLELEIELSEMPGERRALWRQVEGTLPFNEGAWIVEQEGTQTILRYQVSASVRGMPQALVNYAMRRRLGLLLEAVEQRVALLEKEDPMYFSRAK